MVGDLPMDPSSEFLELLREIRDGQRELLVLTKAWTERSERQDQERQVESAKAKAAFARWDEANTLWLQQNRNPTLTDRVVFLIVLVGSIALGIALGIITATGLLR